MKVSKYFGFIINGIRRAWKWCIFEMHESLAKNFLHMIIRKRMYWHLLEDFNQSQDEYNFDSQLKNKSPSDFYWFPHITGTMVTSCFDLLVSSSFSKLSLLLKENFIITTCLLLTGPNLKFLHMCEIYDITKYDVKTCINCWNKICWNISKQFSH